VLLAALGCFVAAALAAASARGPGGLVLAAVLAGIGNAPFHPADFTILNKRVSSPRLGHAFSVHGISGNLGWAVAPVLLIGVAELSGHWRAAYLAAALWALAVLLLLALRREDIDDRRPDAVAAPRAGAAAAATEHPLAFLRLPSVWLCFSFFFWSTAALAAIQSFASPALAMLYGLPLSATAFVVTGYMLCGAAGMVMGGFVVARVQRLELIIGMAMAAGAALLLLVASGMLPPLAAAAVTALAGFGTGLAGPSRDMLIKRAAPPGATGRVYGTVYSGLDVGFALAAPVFGWLLDHGHAGGVFGGSALALLLGVGSASLVALRLRALRPAAA
jgi:predicted MFS family arabinose efflux permease